MNNGKYIYCFIEGRVDEDPGLNGLGGYGRVYFIHHEGITVAVSDVPYMVFEPSRENAVTHEKITQHFLKKYNLVPCSFGNVFKSREDLLKFMSKTGGQINENLAKVRDKMEVGLRVFWKKEVFNDEVETKQIKEMKDDLMKRPDSENYYSRIEFGKMVEEQVNRRREYYVASIYDPLAKRAVDARLNDTSNPLMVMNAAFLIYNAKEHEFDGYVDSVMKKYADRLEFSYSGPWPPYNFTSIAQKT
jgi:hypothetical protein